MEINKEKFLELYQNGKEDIEIGAILNVPKTTITKYRRSLELMSQTDKIRKEKQERFVTLYSKGYNDSEISKILEVSHVTIKKWRESQNLPTNFEYSRKFDTDKFMELYNMGKLYNEIADTLGVSDSAIQNYATSLGLTNNLVNKTVPTYEEEQIILGTLLGDGYLTHTDRMKHVSMGFAHSLKQEEYCKWKQSKLHRFGTYGNYKVEHDARTNNDYSCYYAYFGVSTYFTSIYPKFYNNHVKYISKELLYKVDALGLAVWFMDDGYKDETSYRIATMGFSLEDLNIIQKYFLEKFNIKVTIYKDRTVYIGAAYIDKFTSLVEPYIHEDCKYKLHSRRKTPLNEESPEKDNLVLIPQEIEDNA